jgi:hypothetical protein
MLRLEPSHTPHTTLLTVANVSDTTLLAVAGMSNPIADRASIGVHEALTLFNP